MCEVGERYWVIYDALKTENVVFMNDQPTLAKTKMPGRRFVPSDRPGGLLPPSPNAPRLRGVCFYDEERLFFRPKLGAQAQ